MREIRSITGLRVISVEEGSNVGAVSQVVVDLASGEVLGLIVGSGANECGVAAADIQTIGADVVMVSRLDIAKPLAELPELEKRKAPSTHLVPVFTDSGRRLGVVSGIFIDPYEKVVTRYEISSGALKDIADGLLVLPVIAGTVHGQDAVIVPDEAVREMGRETGGLMARFSQWGDSARKQYQQVAEGAEKMVESSSETLKKEAAVVREKAKAVSEKAKEVTEKAKEVTEKTAKEVSEKAKDVAEKAKDVAGNAAEKAAEAGAKAKEAVSHIGNEEGKDQPAAEEEAKPEGCCGCSGEEKPAEEAKPASEDEPRES